MEPDRVFSCGSIIKFADSKWRVRAIHTGKKGKTSMEVGWPMRYERVYLHPQDNVRRGKPSPPMGIIFSSFSNSVKFADLSRNPKGKGKHPYLNNKDQG
ncbi:MAG: hypothetical protein Ct9H90mP24_7440 [Methanobacteriota archaeon]|nr:MAG: hypothetical protein Ct9H90mP24_7440 [Euryarchaeota archaeon]